MTSPRAVASWAEDFVGAPFVAGGRTRDGADCWGLVRLVYAEAFGKELPALSATTWSRARAERTAETIAAEATRAWREVPVDDVAVGDVLLYAVAGRPAHVGVSVGAGRVLTTLPAIGAHLARADHPRLGARFLSAWRLAER